MVRYFRSTGNDLAGIAEGFGKFAGGAAKDCAGPTVDEAVCGDGPGAFGEVVVACGSGPI